jgi:outer membrane protein OmpA-like peptidoglycan-associated protein
VLCISDNDSNNKTTGNHLMQRGRFGLCIVAGAAVVGLLAPLESTAQEYQGPLLPHVGGTVDYAFQNRFGPDAEASLTFTAVTPDLLKIAYSSTRGLRVSRDVRMIDRKAAKTLVLGYAERMPAVITNTTSLGISGNSLIELRETGKTAISLVHDSKLSRIDGVLTLVERGIKVPILIENQMAQVAAVRATGVFGSGNQTGSGEFYIVDNKNNPMVIQSNLKFSWEKEPRTEKVIRVSAGASMASAMEQSLNTLRSYDVYGLRFDFDKSTLRPESAALIKDIALTLKNNPTWTLQINGHTDSIGKAAYNMKLSGERAASVAAALVQQGIEAGRLSTAGLGATQPKADNGTLQGRATNRRVELKRTDK